MKKGVGTMYKELENKVAVVTGGSKGIGTAIAQRFGKEKMNVVVNYNSDKEGAEKAVKAIEEAGGKAVSVQADVSSEEGIQRLLDTALENFGTLDVWINNAGMENQHPTHELSLEDWERVLKVNLTGVFIGTKAALNYFTENDKKGNIISHNDRKIQISHKGTGKIIGSGNASPTDMASFGSLQPMLFKGRAMVIVRSGYEPGEMKLTVSAGGVQPATIALKTK